MNITIDAAPADNDAMAAFAAKADDLDEIKRCVNEAASASGALWISYLSLLLYTGITVGAVTSVDLFMEKPVKLPFLGADIPLQAFFFLAPLLFLIVHVYTLMSFVILSDKAKWYHRESGRQIDAAAGEDPGRASEIRDDLRRHLVSNIFVQFLAGPGDLRSGPFGLVLKLIVWTTLVVAPVALLLEVQVQFLPFHDAAITWSHRFVLLLDVFAMGWLGYRILAGRLSEEQTRPRWTVRLLPGIIVGAGVIALVFSWTIATFDDGPEENGGPQEMASLRGQDEGTRRWLRHQFFDGAIDKRTRRRVGLLNSTLVLSRFDIYEQLKIDDLTKVASKRSIFNARGRDFRGAVFDLSNLSQVDFEGARLEGASFDLATVRTTSFYCAQMQKVVFRNADMEGAWFHVADLTNADMGSASGQGARFEGAILKGVDLTKAKLQAATLDGANLNDADLTGSSLQGASLSSVPLGDRCGLTDQPVSSPEPATLSKANFKDADLEGAYLQGADLAEVASIEGTKLDNADLSDATLSETQLSSVDKGSSQLGMRLDGLKFADRDRVSMARSVATIGESAIAGGPWHDKAPHAVPTSAYDTRLADKLSKLVCSGEAGSPFIARGLVWNRRIAKMGTGTPGFVDKMLDPKCSIGLALPEDMKPDLLKWKRDSQSAAR